MNIASIVDVCRNYPAPADNEICRNSALDAIDQIFGRRIQVVILEGPPGIGTTTLLAQFLRGHARAAAVFIKATSPHGYDLDFIRLQLYEQVYWHLEAKLPTTRRVQEGELRSAFARLQREVPRGQYFYFIVDGLSQLPDSASDIRTEILGNVLPYAYDDFRFLLCGDYRSLSTEIPAKVLVKPYELGPLSRTETETYLVGLPISEPDKARIHRITNGVPGRIAAIRRGLLSGVSIDALFEDDRSELIDFIRFECQTLNKATEDTKLAVAIAAFGKAPLLLATVAQLAKGDEANLRSALTKLPFLSVNDEGLLEFVSETHQQFVRDQLAPLRNTAIELLLERAFELASGEEKLTTVPEYLADLGRNKEILAFLNPSALTDLFSQLTELRRARRILIAGFDAAQTVRANSEAFQIASLLSLVSMVDEISPSADELTARVKCGQRDEPYLLALNCPLKEQRLRMLARYACLVIEQGSVLDTSVRTQLSDLVAEVDLKASDISVEDIAADLIHVDPDMAMALIDQVHRNDPKSADAAYSALSLAAHRKPDGVKLDDANAKAGETVDGRVLGRIADKELRQFVSAVGTYLGRFSGGEVIGRVSSLSSKNKIYFLGKWARYNKADAEAALVVEEALNTMVSSPEVTPTLSDLRELAQPLKHMADDAEREKLVARINAQIATARTRSPSEDLVRLQALLAEAEWVATPDKAKDRVVDLLLNDINPITDIATRCDCLAWFIALQPKVDPSGIVERDSGIFTQALSKFESDFELLLHGTAEHLAVFDSVIRAFGQHDPMRAADIAEKFNVQYRRDKATAKICRVYASTAEGACDLSCLSKLTDRMFDRELAEKTICEILETLKERRPKSIAQLRGVWSLYQRRSKINTLSRKIRTALSALELHCALDEPCPQTLDEVVDELVSVLELLEPDWERVKYEFRAAEVLAAYNKETAKKFLDRGGELSRRIPLMNRVAATTMLYSADLASRAFCGLIEKRQYLADDLSELAVLIDSVISPGPRISLWSQFAVWCWARGDRALSERVVTTWLTPCLNSIKTTDVGLYWTAFERSAPALFITQPNTALAELSKAPLLTREESILKICQVLVRRIPTTEPYEEHENRPMQLAYEDVASMLKLADLLQNDDNFFLVIEYIAKGSREVKGTRITREQRHDIALQIERLIAAKLPDPRNIQHEGFVIASHCLLGELRKAPAAFWDGLIVRAEKLPNVSDSAFCLTTIYNSIPDAFVKQREQVAFLVRSKLRDIPSDIDRCDRCELLCSMFEQTAPKLAREIITLGFEQRAAVRQSESMHDNQRRMIEVLFRLDSKVASDFVSRLDDDVAREDAKLALRKRLDVLELRKALGNLESEQIDDERRELLPTACWKRLGALNAGFSPALSSVSAERAVIEASKLELNSAFPIYSLVVQSAVLRFKTAHDIERIVRPMYLSLLLTGKLCSLLSARLTNVRAEIVSASPWRSQELVFPGAKEDVIDRIRTWLRANSTEKELFLCDPYFGPEEMWLARLVKEECPMALLRIFTSRLHIGGGMAIEDKFVQGWRNISVDAEPPECEITICGFADTGQLPIHDRWFVATTGGLRFGSSVGGLGLTRISEISSFLATQAQERAATMREFVEKRPRQKDGRGIKYTAFTLP